MEAITILKWQVLDVCPVASLQVTPEDISSQVKEIIQRTASLSG